MPKFESVFNSSELPPPELREGIPVERKIGEKPVSEESGQLESEVEKRKRKDAEQMEIIRRELAAMQAAEADAEKGKGAEPLTNIEHGRKVLADTYGMPFTFISNKELREVSRERWVPDDSLAAINGELEKRKNRGQVAEAFLGVSRFVGRNSIRATRYLLDAIYYIRTLHWEERPLEESLERVRMLKKNPLFRAIGEAEEKKIKAKIGAREKFEEESKRSK